MQDDFQYKYQRQRITKELNKYSISELKDICYGLGINYEDLAGYTNSNRRDIRRELQMEMERKGRNSELMGFLVKFAKKKNTKRKRSRHPIKKHRNKEEAYAEMANKLNDAIFVPLNTKINFGWFASLLLGSVGATYSFYYQLPFYSYLVYTSVGLLLIPICATALYWYWFSNQLRANARRNMFYELTVIEREHSKDKLNEILRTSYQFPARPILLIISNSFLWTNLNKRK